MRTNIDHLPQVQQDELARVVRILMDGFEEATARATQPWRRGGKFYKIILFGGYARDDWVDEPENGYQSDFDLLIVVSHRDLTEIADYWYVAEDKILRDEAVGRPVNIIVHSIDEVNRALRRGEYFWVDIVRDGIALYELPQHELARPVPASPQDALEIASGYFHDWIGKIDSSLKGANFYKTEQELKDAAFTLHQATERAYACFLLVRTLYFPRSHNIKFLRSLSEDNERGLHHLARDLRVVHVELDAEPVAGVHGRASHDPDEIFERAARFRDLLLGQVPGPHPGRLWLVRHGYGFVRRVNRTRSLGSRKAL